MSELSPPPFNLDEDAFFRLFLLNVQIPEYNVSNLGEPEDEADLVPFRFQPSEVPPMLKGNSVEVLIDKSIDWTWFKLLSFYLELRAPESPSSPALKITDFFHKLAEACPATQPDHIELEALVSWAAANIEEDPYWVEESYYADELVKELKVDGVWVHPDYNAEEALSVLMGNLSIRINFAEDGVPNLLSARGIAVNAMRAGGTPANTLDD